MIKKNWYQILTRIFYNYSLIYYWHWALDKTKRTPASPECTSGWRQRAHKVGNVVGNVDGQWGNLGLDGPDWRFRHVPRLLLVIGQGCERNLYTCAGEPKTTPENERQDIKLTLSLFKHCVAKRCGKLSVFANSRLDYRNSILWLLGK